MFKLGDIHTSLQINAFVDHFGRNQVATFIVEPAQDLFAAVHLRHLDAQTIENARKFAGDITAADNQDRLGQVIKQENLVRCDRQIGAFNRRFDRATTNSHQNMFGGKFLTGGQGNGVRILDRRAGIKGLNARPVQQAAIDAL